MVYSSISRLLIPRPLNFSGFYAFYKFNAFSTHYYVAPISSISYHEQKK